MKDSVCGQVSKAGIGILMILVPKKTLLDNFLLQSEQKNITFGIYYSLYEWLNALYLDDKSTGSPPTKRSYVEGKLLPELVDVVTRYKPSLIWTDGDWEQPSEYWESTKFLAWLYNESPVKDYVVTNDRWGNECRGRNGGYWTPSDGYNPGRVIEHKWENCQTITTSWGYNRKEHLEQVKTARQLIEELVSVVVYGGNFLLNMSPTSDGLIPIIQEERLKEIGEWLGFNGDAIYATRPWRIQKQHPNIYYSSKGKTIYAIFFNWPDNRILVLPQLTTNPVVPLKVTFLQTNQQLTAKALTEGISIELPYLTIPIAKQPGWVCKMEGIQ